VSVLLTKVLSWLLWPLLLGGSCILVAAGRTVEQQKVLFLVAYGLLLGSIALLERVLPHERAWLKSDGQLFADVGHTLTLKGTTFVVSFLAVHTGSSIASSGAPWWPHHWPLLPQVALALVVAEFALYWHHRIAHEWRPLWHFHAVHHSVTKLWWVNTGRFHFGDSLVSVAMTQPVLYLSGAPDSVLLWVGYVTMFIGVLTHCNIEMRFGPLNWVFNTPGLHRWHHSRNLDEGNKNYGENLMLWDHLFGTYFDAARRPPADIGIREVMPARFVDQLLYPFRALRSESAAANPMGSHER
jgi:sterol desaturase/sphingolipid hydroxylase (fatty acid hydroxylase superfamily)